MLPFLRIRWLHAHALVLGCCAPDLAYLFDIHREISHDFVWGVPCALAVGLLAFVWAETLVLPALSALVPSIAWVDIQRLFTPRFPPRSWLAVVCALAVGALTHILWDGLTHPGWWPALVVFSDRMQVAGPKMAWKYSTLIGTGIVMLWLWYRYRGARLLDMHWLGWIAGACILAAFFATFIIGWNILPRDPEVPHWPAQILAMRAAFAVMTVWCWFFKSVAHVER